jgi:hypothetical protein
VVSPAIPFQIEMALRFALLITGFLAVQAVHALDKVTLARVTCYWREENQLRAASNGVRLRNGHCAVDPKKIPYGSKIVLDNEELIAVDTGPAVVNRKAARLSGRNKEERNAMVIDRYFETKWQALAWEKRHPHFMKIRVLSPEIANSRTAISERMNVPPPRVVSPPARISRSEGWLSAVSMSEFYFRAFPESSNAIARHARRRSGGTDLCLVHARRSGGLPLDRFDLRRLQIG